MKPALPPVPGGTYMATCVYSIEIGEQLCKYKDKGESYNNQVMLGFELAGVDIEIDGEKKPRVLGRTFNIAQKKVENSALYNFVNLWTGKQCSVDEFKDVDTNSLVGKAAMLSVVLSADGAYSNIKSAISVPLGMPAPTYSSELIRFDIKPWDQAAFDALPEWAKERIRKSKEYQRDHAPTDTIAVQPPTEVQAPSVPPVQNPPVVPTAVGGAPF